MDGGFQFFDIIIFAFIAAFLVFRLRRVLGRRDGHEGGYSDRIGDAERRKAEQAAYEREQDGDDNVVQLPDRAPAPVADEASGPSYAADTSDLGPIGEGVTLIRVADPSFHPDEFAEGAKMAFEMILNAFAGGDRATLRNLLSPDVYENFDAAITEREREGETLEDTLVGIRTSEIIEATMDGHHALVTLKFVSEQISALRDAEGQVIDGNPNEVIDVTDFWTFSRDTRSSDPNWTLVGTESNN